MGGGTLEERLKTYGEALSDVSSRGPTTVPADLARDILGDLRHVLWQLGRIQSDKVEERAAWDRFAASLVDFFQVFAAVVCAGVSGVLATRVWPPVPRESVPQDGVMFAIIAGFALVNAALAVRK